MSDIFISYRREDSADVTGRISDYLYREFGSDKVFKDVDNMPLGIDFRQHLDTEVGHCSVFIAVIGPDWLSISDEQGQSRLDDPADFVRIEIESALNRDIPVIPVLVRSASMPTENQLPASIQPFAYRNATLVRADPDFSNDIKRLISGIKSHISQPEPEPEALDLSQYYDRLHLAKNSGELERLQLEVGQLAKTHDDDLELKLLRQKIAKAVSSLQIKPRDTAAPAPAPPRPRSTSTFPMGYQFASILVVMISIGIYFYIGPGQQTDPDIDQVVTTANNRDAQINALLERAQQAFDEQRQTEQPVLEILQEVQRLDPGNPRASEMLEQILRRYLQLAEEAIARGDFGILAEYLAQARRVNPDSRRSQEVLDRLNHMVNEAREAARDAAEGKKPGQVFQDRLSSGGEGPPMVIIPAGTFLMGSTESEKGRRDNEGPQHEVNIRSFALGKTEVTFEQYDHFAEATGRGLHDDSGWGRGNRPVINVNWNDATAYAEWLSELIGKRYHLPSEAEWEYAARAGSTSRFHFGDDDAELCNYTNFWDKSPDPKSTRCDDGVGQQTAAVGRYQPNRLGLLDINGNVWEWTQDCWHTNYQGAPADGSAWIDGECAGRVLRGGSWDAEPVDVRSAFRYWLTQDNRNSVIGFRLARDL